jgi:hypothetical protein
MKKSIKSGLVSATLAASLLLSSTGVFAFTDVDSSHWASADIEKLSNKGYISGYEDGSFAPSNFITRAEFVTIINKVKNVSATSGKTFPDVSTDAWYANEIDKAVTAGFITGYDNGTVRPDACISRAEVAVVCYKAWNLSPEGTLNFTDSDSIGSWAQSQVATLVSKNVLSGYEDGSFRPDDAITRAEVAKVVSRLLEMSTSTTTTTTTTTSLSTPAGLSNTSVVIKNGVTSSGSSSSSSGSSSSSSSSKPSKTQTAALEAFADDDVSDSDYISTLNTVAKYSDVSVTVKKAYKDLYMDVIDALIDELGDTYDDYDLDDKTDAKKLANDIATMVLAVNNSVDKVKSLSKSSKLTESNLLDYADDLEDLVDKYATKANRSDIKDVITDFCTDLYNKMADDIEAINGTTLSDTDVVNIYNGDYDADKDAPTKTEQSAIEKLVDGSTVTASNLNTIIGYSDVEVTADSNSKELYNDAIDELLDAVDYSDLDLSTTDASIVANDVATIVSVVNESVDKVIDLAKDGKLDKSSLVDFQSTINSIVENNATSSNKAEIKSAIQNFAIELYSKIADDLDSLNGTDVTVSTLIDLYNSNK